MSRDLPPWFTEAWVIVAHAPKGRRRHIVYWTRAKYDRMVPWLRSRGLRVLYGIHVTHGALRPSVHYRERAKLKAKETTNGNEGG